MLSTGPRNEVRFISGAIRCFGYLRAEIFGQCKLIFSTFNLLFLDSCGLGQGTCSGQQVYGRALGEKGRQGQGLCPGLGSSAVNGLTDLPFLSCHPLGRLEVAQVRSRAPFVCKGEDL